MELSELKRSREILLSVLNVTKTGKHLPCPFHGSGDSFSIWQWPDGVWAWKCNSMGCGSGTVLDAALKVYRVQSVVEALRAMEAQLGIKIIRDEEYTEPQIDQDAANGFVNDAHENLIDSPEIQERWMMKKRGIFNLDTIKRYRIGFVTPDKFSFANKKRGNKTSKPWLWNIFGWVLPITNASGVLVAVKMHFEKSPFPWTQTDYAKCMWAPFGTYPATDPKDGAATLWPPPEDFQGAEKLFICPGELKALAMIGAGMAATSPTAGESTLKPELVRRIIRAKPEKTFITFDDDAPKMVNGKWVSAGNKWKDSVIRSLKGEGMLCYAFAFGKKKEPILLESENEKGSSDNRSDDQPGFIQKDREPGKPKLGLANPIREESIDRESDRAIDTPLSGDSGKRTGVVSEILITPHTTAADIKAMERFRAGPVQYERKNILED